ncbi:serine/threonine-protein kinase [Paractinoplanes ovalisporus]|uniref:serine/threonine-protein kinase n=1 Tax=Paractinoplanes ovalisporus TaxID=2810368 RepID=UPI0027DD4A72|nr:serine/threonine-protein kinase [Actinoplanes ovalisporus]
MVAGIHLQGRYQVERLPLPHSGMGEVWPAQDTVLNRPVIIKTVPASTMDVDLARRFRREAQLTARLVHPGVPAVYDFGHHEGRFYLVLELIKGTTLSDLIAEHDPLPIAWVAAIGAQISSVLIAARRIGLVHRDIKPGNAMLEASGAVRVLDFGLAAIHGDDRYSRITQSGQSLGTIGYMAPEQIEAKPTDHRTDLYGLGATLFDLLTGRAPFDGSTTMITVQSQMRASPPHPAELRDDVPPAVDDLVHALLARHPQDRPTSAADVYAALAPFAQNLPPIPGAVSDQPDAVRAYAAVVGQVPVRTDLTAQQTDLDPTDASAEEKAESLAAGGNLRAAAQLWRRLAEERAIQYGPDDPKLVEYRMQAIRLHADLGEGSRALRQLRTLLDDLTRIGGPDHPAAVAVQKEMARISETGSA